MTKTKKPSAKEFKIEWNIPQNMDSKYATNFTLQHFENHFKMSCYEIKPDIILSLQDRKKVDQRGTIRADCIGSYIITRDNLIKLKEIIETQLSKKNIP